MTRIAQSGSSSTTSVTRAPEGGPPPGAVSSALPAVSARSNAAAAPRPRPRSTAAEVARIFTTNTEFDRDVAATLGNANQFNEQTRALFTEGEPLAQRYLADADQRSEFIRQIQAVANSPSNSEDEEGKRKRLAQIATKLTNLTCYDVENVRSNYVRLATVHKESNDCATQINQVRYNAAISNFVLGSDAAGKLFNDARDVEVSAQAAANAAQGCHRAIEEAVNELRTGGLAEHLARAQAQAKDIMHQLTLPQHEGGPSITRHEQRDDTKASPGAAVKPSGGDAFTEEEMARRRRNDELAALFAPRHPVIATIRRTWARTLMKMGIGPSSAKRADT